MFNLTLYVLDPGGRRIGLVEGITSLQWLLEFSSCGEVKLVCGLTDKNLELLRQWNMLYNTDTPDVAAIITYVEPEADAKSSKLTIRAQFSASRWNRRVCKGSYTVTDAADGILSIARANLRGLGVTVPDSAGFSAPCEETIEWGDCLSAFEKLADAGGFGFYNRFYPTDGHEELTLLRGVDRSLEGTPDYRGFFSPVMQNLSAVRLTLDGSDVKNAAIGGGAKEDGKERVLVEVGTVQGAERRELWVDAGSVSRQYQFQKTDGSVVSKTYTEAEYLEQVRLYTTAALLRHYNLRKVTATAEDGVLSYGRDYRLGDVLPVIFPAIGLRCRARVSGIRITYENSGKKINPIFGDFTLF